MSSFPRSRCFLGGEVPEVAPEAESEAADTGATQGTGGADGDTASESSHTATSLPSATSQGEAAARGKGKDPRPLVTPNLRVNPSRRFLYLWDRLLPLRLILRIHLTWPTKSARKLLLYKDVDICLYFFLISYYELNLLAIGRGGNSKAPRCWRGKGLGSLHLGEINGPVGAICRFSRTRRSRGAPQAPAKKKPKRSDALKGIQISENPPMPSLDDVSATAFCFAHSTR
jgi:hypothetical protein